MCGRYTLIDIKNIINTLGLPASTWSNWAARYNVTPGQRTIIIRRIDGKLVIDDDLLWGYEHPYEKTLVFNSKSEKIEGTMWGSSFRQRRALVPASGFYDRDKKNDQWYYFRLKSREQFFFPGVWKDDRVSFATCEPNEIVRPIHHRMPVILVSAEQCQEWLERPAKELLQQLPANLMEAYPIKRFGTRDSAQNIEPLTTPIAKQGNLFE